MTLRTWHRTNHTVSNTGQCLRQIGQMNHFCKLNPTSKDMKSRLIIALAIVVVLVIPQTHARDCRKDERESCNALLWLDEQDKRQAELTHLPFGIPTAPEGFSTERLLHHKEMVINYDGALRVPTWVAYRLRDEDLHRRSRVDCF